MRIEWKDGYASPPRFQKRRRCCQDKQRASEWIHTHTPVRMPVACRGPDHVVVMQA